MLILIFFETNYYFGTKKNITAFGYFESLFWNNELGPKNKHRKQPNSGENVNKLMKYCTYYQ